METAAIQRKEKTEQMITGYVFTLIRLQGAFEKAGIQFDQHIPYDDSEEVLEEPIPPLSGFFRVMTFCLLMASIGSGAGTICHFCAPDLTALAGASESEAYQGRGHSNRTAAQVGRNNRRCAVRPRRAPEGTCGA